MIVALLKSESYEGGHIDFSQKLSVMSIMRFGQNGQIPFIIQIELCIFLNEYISSSMSFTDFYFIFILCLSLMLHKIGQHGALSQLIHTINDSRVEKKSLFDESHHKFCIKAEQLSEQN